MNLMLYGLQSPVNLGLILRSSEVYQWRVVIIDIFDVLESSKNVGVIRDFSCGAWDRCHPMMLDKETDFGRVSCGSLIATTTETTAKSHADFTWNNDDTLIVGNEYDGLPDHVMDIVDYAINVRLPSAHLPKPQSHSAIDPSRNVPPAFDGRPSLNVAITSSIIMASAYEMLWRSEKYRLAGGSWEEKP